MCIHTELFNFGVPMMKKTILLKSILDCFFSIIKKSGTLIMPTFTYSFCENEIYNKQCSQSYMGTLTNFFRTQSGVKRTNDPIFSFAIKGAKQDLFLKDTKSCFGENCVYDVLAKENGKIILFGMNNKGFTFSHFTEEKMQVSYRYYKTFRGSIVDNNIEKVYSIKYFVRDLTQNSHLNINKQIEILKKTNNFNECIFAGAPIVSINAKKYLNENINALTLNEKILISN
nr:AAC(3) family N-acetyltransferase [Campylobacter volucris]